MFWDKLCKVSTERTRQSSRAVVRRSIPLGLKEGHCGYRDEAMTMLNVWNPNEVPDGTPGVEVEVEWRG
jgi:hypothetical protein